MSPSSAIVNCTETSSPASTTVGAPSSGSTWFRVRVRVRVRVRLRVRVRVRVRVRLRSRVKVRVRGVAVAHLVAPAARGILVEARVPGQGEGWG